MTKEQLLQLPEVKSLMLDIIKDKYSKIINTDFFEFEFESYKSSIIKPEWEILSFKFKSFRSDNIVRHKNKYGLFPYGNENEPENRNNEFTEQELLNDESYIINSVRRLSDGEIFTVGDKYKNASGEFTIESFKIEDGKMWVHATEFGQCLLENISKVKYLFKDAEGKEVKEEDRVYSITDSNEIVYSDVVSKEQFTEERLKRTWLSRESAEKYLIENAPVLSIKDLLDKSSYHPDSQLAKTIRNLVKEKLNIK